MPAAYSYDLRKKAIEAVKRGERKIDVCHLLRISRNTLDLWLKREEKTGDYQSYSNKQRPMRKIKDEAKFREFVRNNEDKTQGKMAELWGENVTQQNISYACQKFEITRKKKPMAMKKEMRINGLNSEKS